MRGPVYCGCGALLLEALGEHDVQPVGSDEPITFRRATDYVICSECLSVYSAQALRGGRSPAESLVEDGQGHATEEGLIERLERIIEGVDPPPPGARPPVEP